ncbi:S8 family serine peptidase [Planococcus halocryophilus]|uniref:S8 family serine peptidase n=1 Tax=Planococcus halocryophilus TaxID=1215089 RepID=UPI001F0D2AD2|nr:S8 family serine peptidase [Planococcus halocryophilus]MCH4826811.1 S8 family serine peptidase [Planococcus halocryophilus]
MKIVYGTLIAILLSLGLGQLTTMAQEDEEKRMIIVYEEEQKGFSIAKKTEDFGGSQVEAFDEISVVSASMTEAEAQQLLADPTVRFIEEDIIFSLSSQTEGWGIPQIKAPLAWDSGFTGKGVKIAVLDSGIATHNDLVVAGGVSTVDYTTSYKDDQGHGTHVAGIIGARNNGIGIKGVAYDAQLYAVKAFDNEGNAYLSDLIEGVEWAITNGMDIINLSGGSPQNSTAFKEVFDRAYAHGLLIVAAAGNVGDINGTADNVEYPARYSTVIAVGALGQKSLRAEFSSTGSTVEVMAPGVEVYSTVLNNGYGLSSGTSMATPYVAGQLALMKQAYPELTNKELRAIMTEEAKDLGEVGKDIRYGNGLIQISSYKAPRISEVNNPLVKLSLNKTSITSAIDKSVQLELTASYTKGEVISATETAKWLSANPAVATVVKGKVVPKSIGNTTITASLGSKTISIKVTVPQTADMFTDVPKEYFPAIDYLVRNEITNGETTTKFGIQSPILRVDAAIWLAKELKLDMETAPASEFTDVPARAVSAVNALKHAGYINGKTKTSFGATQKITRGEIALILKNGYKLQPNEEKLPFTDVSERYEDSVNALAANNITNGLTTTKFGVSQNVTRGQLAIFIYRLANM